MDPHTTPPLTARREAALLLAVVAAAVLTRVLWYAGDIPRFWFAETTSVWIANAFEQGDLWQQWTGLLGNTQGTLVEHSATMMPVAAAFQAVLGPSLHLPTLLGAFWGTLAVVLAWRLGRAIDSPAFGLLFAGLLAASPLAITWSRIGGVPPAAAAQVLLVCWLGQRAGARGSLVLGVLAGAAAWASLYYYFPTRAALGLVFVALLSGLVSSRPGLLRGLVVLGACAVTLALAFVAIRPAGVWLAIWPQFTGYVGVRGTQTSAQILADATTTLWRELPHALRVYFWSDRNSEWYLGTTTSPPGNALTPSIASGGLCLLPVGLLGAVGLALAVRHALRDALWLAIAALGLMAPGLSAVTARRFVVFDLAWCALAAGGLVALLGARRSPRRLAAGVAIVLALAAYSFAVVMALDARLPPYHPAPIPFGESGFGDGRVCLACARQSRRWEDAIRAGSFVVLFDSDVDRENPTVPSGLPLYGKVAALAAGKPHRFVAYYPLAMNFNQDPPRAAPIFAAHSTPAAYLAAEIERDRPTDIRWAFPQPTQWERWVADRLERAGGERRAVDDPSLAPTMLADPGFEIVTPWDRRADALAVIRELAGPVDGTRTACLAVATVGIEDHKMPALVLAPRADAAPGHERWIVGSYHVVRDGTFQTAVEEPVGIGVDGWDGSQRLDILTRATVRLLWDPGTAATSYVTPPAFHAPLGVGCAVRIREEWWAIDPILGYVARSTSGQWLPPGNRWVGIAADPTGRLVLASADQTLHVFDVDGQRELASFPAHVPPSRRIHFAECSPLVAGDGWIATLDHLRHRLFVYDRDGVLLAVLPVNEVPPMVTHQPTTLAADGSFLGISTDWTGLVTTLRLTVAAGCPRTDLPRGSG